MLSAIKHLFPTAVLGVDFVLQDDGHGPFIAQWNLNQPEPTPNQLQAVASLADFESARALELTKFRVDRESFLNRLAGIGLAALHQGQTEILDSIVTVRQGLLDLTSCAGVVAATDLDDLKSAMKSAYAAVLAGVPAEVKTAFKGVDA